MERQGGNSRYNCNCGYQRKSVDIYFPCADSKYLCELKETLYKRASEKTVVSHFHLFIVSLLLQFQGFVNFWLTLEYNADLYESILHHFYFTEHQVFQLPSFKDFLNTCRETRDFDQQPSRTCFSLAAIFPSQLQKKGKLRDSVPDMFQRAVGGFNMIRGGLI